MDNQLMQDQRANTRPRLLRLICAGLAGALSAFALPIAAVPAKAAISSGKSGPAAAVPKKR